MKNLEVIQAFIRGETKGHTTHLKIDGNKLINYSTPICWRVWECGHWRFILNARRYSNTTTRIQNMIRRSIPKFALREVDE